MIRSEMLMYTCRLLWVLILVICISSAVYPNNSFADNEKNVTKFEELQILKLESEIEKLEKEIEYTSSAWARFSQAAPFITAVIALLGVFITIWKQINESSRQREVDRRQLEREQARRFDERFNQITEGLGSTVDAIRAGAAVSIISYLKPEHIEFHDQVFLILMANLKIAHDEVTNSLLVKAFEQSIRIKSKQIEKENSSIEEKEDKISLDISHCYLPKLHLPGINLSWANVQESDLQYAYLNGACLQRLKAQHSKCSYSQISKADLRKAVFDSCEMVKTRFTASDLRWVHFKGANLQEARFQQALLQSALFNDADLRGARFEQADLNNATFKGATLDKVTMKSIVKAYHWRDAHFDEQVKRALNDVEVEVWAERNVQQ